jgi:Flp pilus assembly protein TadG
MKWRNIMAGGVAILKCIQKSPLSPKRRGGQALIEAAVAILFVVLLVVMCVDLGRLLYAKVVLTNAAREAAYFLSYHPLASKDDFTEVARLETLSTGISYAAFSAFSPDCCTVDQPVTVTVRATLDNFILLGSINTSNSVTMMVMR